ncbi:MAG: biotin--[acetyl-CoA-carboxylase] ligase [Candidatus Bipolaricaulaceae bacterium]
MEFESVLFALPEGLEGWEALSKRTGLSPAGLREALLALQAQGFPILLEEGGAGLALGAPAPQILAPLLRGSFGRAYRYFGVVTSTQDLLRAWRDAPSGAVVLAEAQLRGRGRRGRVWESPPGNLYFSVLLKNAGDPLLPFRAGLALAEAAQVGKLKWPNDLLAPDGRKLGGILVEVEKERVFLGVGLNVSVAPIPESAALQEFRRASRAQLLADFLWSLESWLEKENEAVLCAWLTKSMTIGQKVRVQTGKEAFVGVASALGPQGELLVRTKEGTRAVFAGDVRLLRVLEDIENPKISEGQA